MTRCRSSARWLAALGLALGLWAPAPRGCGYFQDCGDETPPAPAYVMTTELDPEWVGGGLVEVDDERLTITYDTKDGSSWQVVYQRLPD